MGSNGKDEIMTSNIDEAECSEATVEIKIKTLESQTYTLRVDKCVPVPALKEQIASVTGVLSEQQRLICRGKVLKDDQLLSAYHVEDGHTLHLVVRQPIAPGEDLPATDSTSSAGLGQGHSGPSVLVGTFNVSEQGDGGFPDLNRIVSAVLSSFGISGATGSSTEGLDLREATGGLLSRIPGLSGLRESSRPQTDQAATMGQYNSLSGASPSLPTASPLELQQPPVIPDSMTTLSQYMSCLRNEFGGSVRGDSNNSRAAGTQSNSVQGTDAASHAAAGQGGLPTPTTLAEVMLSTRQILAEEAVECLSQLSRQLENHSNVVDSSSRMSIQSNAIRSGALLQNLGVLLLELGRTTMTLRMGQTPGDAVVNAGPAVFISTSGPNPIMVQPLPFQPGTSFGAIPMGNSQPGTGTLGTLGSGLMPRNIDIRIRTGSLMPTAVVNQREPAGATQSPEQANPLGGLSVHPAAAGASGGPSSTRETEVRVVPIRTVVAAVPAHVRRLTSDSSHNSVGLLYPVLARVQHVTSGISNSARGSQASDDHRERGLDLEQHPIQESAGQQQSGKLSGRNGDGHLGGGVQHNQGFSALPSRIDQFIRAIFPNEQIHIGSDVNFQDSATGSATQNVGTTETAGNSEEATFSSGDEGTFLSNLLRQIMPFISQSSAMGSNMGASERADALGNADSQTSPTEETSNVGTSSHRRADPPSSPNSKRQKRV